MRVFRSLEEAGQALDKPAVAIGNFDGLHRGHQALIEAARGRPGPTTVLTFHPHPVRVLAPHLAPSLLLTEEEKLDGLRELGVEATIVCPFDADFAQTPPSAFVQRLLLDQLKAGHVVVGYDFSFGKGGQGDTDLLERLLSEAGCGLSIIEAVKEGGLVCSSTQIRQFVLEGRVAPAALLLGRPYWISGTIVEGDHRGKQLGIPTANVNSERETIPRVGVYATRARTADGRSHASVTNVGLRPTFEGQPLNKRGVRIEAHLLDYDGPDIYGQVLRLEFIERVRDERRFSGPDALRAQIADDIAAARGALGG